MCTTCGCGGAATPGQRYAHAPPRANRLAAHGPGAAHHAAGISVRTLQIEADILGKNAAYARENRRRIAARGIVALNLMSSPGAGKTSLLVRTIAALASTLPITVIEGDQQTSRDADRIREAGARAVQINTGKGCHLDAQMVARALVDLEPGADSLLFIENVGNLVCPAAFDLGEARRVVVLSVTEGDDKPLKYPDMFRTADLLVVNKIDLLPYVDFDVEAALEYARRVRPELLALAVSARTGEGFDAWLSWLQGCLPGRPTGASRRSTEAATAP